MAKMIQFVLDGCDISFVAEAPEDITLKQLLAQCDKIKPDWCACGIHTANSFPKEAYTEKSTEIVIGYDNIKKVKEIVSCKIIERD